MFTVRNMTKTVSARITKEIHEKLVDKCNLIGCTVNDYLNGAIELAMTGSTEQDLGDEFDEGLPPQPEQKSTNEIPTAKNVRVSYDDGKTWINV